MEVTARLLPRRTQHSGGYHTITGPRWQTAAEVARLERKGYVEVTSYTERRATGDITISYLQLKPLPARWVRPVKVLIMWIAILVIGVMWLAALGWALWQLRAILVAGAAVLALAWWLVKRVRHQGACIGLHCGGCRG